MITMLISVLLGVGGTVGFVRSIRREVGARATLIEWFLSAEIGFLIGAGTFSLLR
jgi:hypothetical protein